MDRNELVDILRKNVGSPHETVLSNIWVHEVIKMLKADGERILSLQNRVSELEEAKRVVEALSEELARTREERDKYKALASSKGNTNVVLKAPDDWKHAELELANAVKERDDLRSVLAQAYQERDQYMELASGMKSDCDHLVERVRTLADMVVWYGMTLAQHHVYSLCEDEDVIAAYNRKYNGHKTDSVVFRRDM